MTDQHKRMWAKFWLWGIAMGMSGGGAAGALVGAVKSGVTGHYAVAMAGGIAYLWTRSKAGEAAMRLETERTKRDRFWGLRKN